MSTVGLNFGSATSGAGFDVAATVNSILAIQQGIETPLKAQVTSLQAQDTALTTLGSDLSTLTSSLQSLTDANGVFAAKKGSSSNNTVLTLTGADATAVAGSHTVVVTSLATTASKYSDPITGGDTLSGSLTINGHQISVVTGTSDTLAGLSAAINNASVGVVSSVITDANGSRLSLVSTTSGAAGSITLSGTLTDSTTSTAITFPGGQAGANAALTVDGLSIASASNTVTGAIPGVTFQLLSSPGTSVQIQVTNDNSAIENAVNSLVSAYNSVIKDINSQEKATAGVAAPLYGNPTLSLIQTQLQGAIYGGNASGSINSITQLGLGVNSDGTLTLNNSALDSSLNAHFSDIAGFLQNSGSFGQKFAATLNTLGSQSTTGAVSLALNENSSREKSLNASIANEEALIADERKSLTAELTLANQELQSIPSQLLQVNEIYSAISGYNQQR